MEPVLKSYREAIPINEFKQMEEQLTGAFPHIFMFGKAYGTNSLGTEHFRHLLFSIQQPQPLKNNFYFISLITTSVPLSCPISVHGST
jgi:hypothetical protein